MPEQAPLMRLPRRIRPVPIPDPVLALAVIWLLALTLAAITAPWLPLPPPYEQDLLNMLAPPSAEHWLGADTLGRDLLSRVIYGARISLTVGLGSVAIGLFIGGFLGLLAGYYRGWREKAVMGAVNVMLAFPALVLAIVIVANLGGSLLNVTIAIGVLFIPSFARIARANTLAFRNREFVQVARALGAGNGRILLREILPNLLGALLSYSLVMFAIAVIAEASLGFLGLSVPPPSPSWGSMISRERPNLASAPYAVFAPGAAMFLTVVALNVLGERLQRIFDIRKTH